MGLPQRLLSVELLVVLLTPARAIPERMQEPVNAGRNIHLMAHGYGRDVSQCIRQARKDHCRISDCLKATFAKCPEALDASIMNTFCEMSRRENSPFSHMGVKWIRHTSHCMVISLAQQARLTPCNTIDVLLDNVFDECATDNHLCDIIEMDYEALAEVFKGSWMPIVKAARQCPRDVLDNFVQRSVDFKKDQTKHDL